MSHCLQEASQIKGKTTVNNNEYLKIVPHEQFWLLLSTLVLQVTGEQLMSFFAQVGEIKYVRMGAEEVDGGKCGYIEFTDQRSICTALTYNGVMFQGKPLRLVFFLFPYYFDDWMRGHIDRFPLSVRPDVCY